MVPDKIERVWRFHQSTLHALLELVQAAGVNHPSEITAAHIVRRTANQDVRLLANHLPYLAPGQLLDAIAGSADWPHRVFKLYWPLAQSNSFQPAAGVQVSSPVSALA